MRLLFVLMLLPSLVKAAESFSVGLLDDRAPYSDFTILHRPEGALPEILELLSVPGESPLTLTPAMDMPQLESLLRKRQVSMILPPPLSPPPDDVLTSHPLLYQRWALVSRNNHLPIRLNHDLNLNQQRILLLRSSPVGPRLTTLWPNIVLEQETELRDALKMLNAGAADGLVCDAALADMLAHNLYPGKLISEPLPGVASDQAFWLLPGQEALLERINQRIDTLPPGAAPSVITRWLLSAALSDIQPVASLEGWPDYVVIACAVASLFLIAFLVSEIIRRRRADLGLLNALSYWQTLLNSVPEPLLACDPAGTVTHCNPALLRALRLRADQVIGRTTDQLWALCPMRPAPGHHDWVATLTTRQPRFADRILRVQGEDREIAQWLAVYCDSRNVPQGLLIGWYDISERKRLERELAVSSREAVRASREKTEFLARMSHEIRSPMNAILGLLELEKQKRDEPGSPLSVAYAASCQLLHIIGGVLDLSKIEAGEITLQLQSVALDALLRQVSDTGSALAVQKGLRMERDTDAVRGCHYRTDGPRLSQVLGNLLSNAIKYTPEGFVGLAVTREPSACGRERLTFTVTDSGPGIARDMQKKILQPYVQVDPDAPDSSGLGLAICTQLLKLMNSHLQIASEPGKGAAFSFTLLLEKAEPPPAAGPAEPLSTPGRPQRILVVDDQAANRTVMTLQLESLGHRVTTCDDGRQAEALLMQQTFDLVLTDCQMPVMSGYQLAQRVRAREGERGGYQVIVGCTASAFSDEQVRCLRSGMDAVLIKPLTLQDLRGMLSEQQQACLNMAEIRAMAAGQPHIIATLLGELRRSSGEERRTLAETPPLREKEYAAALHRQKGSFALAGFQAGVALCGQIESALAAESAAMSPLYGLQLNALIMRFIALLAAEEQ